MDTDIQHAPPTPLAFRWGMLLGLAVFVVDIVGLILLTSLKSRLGGMSPDVDQGWITYDFMDDHIVALSLAWTGLCVAAPSTYLAKRRYWRGLRGMLLVSGIALLLLLGFVLYANALGRGLAAATG